MRFPQQQTRLAHRESNSPHADNARRIIFFYEDFDAAIRCRTAFDFIAHSFGDGRPVDASSWSFSMLGASEFKAAILAEFNASVLAEAKRADVIVISARGDKALPARLATLIEKSVKRGGKARPLLLALPADGMTPDNGAAPLCSSLGEIAIRQGTRSKCIMDLVEPEDDEIPSATILPRSAGSSRTEGAVPAPATVADRWWGIND